MVPARIHEVLTAARQIPALTGHVRVGVFRAFDRNLRAIQGGNHQMARVHERVESVSDNGRSSNGNMYFRVVTQPEVARALQPTHVAGAGDRNDRVSPAEVEVSIVIHRGMPREREL